MMLSLVSYASAIQIYNPDTEDVVVSTFENAGEMDGWIMNGSNTATAGIPNPPGPVATDGYATLKVTTGSSWWNEAMYIDLGAIGKEAVLGNNTFSVDVSMFAADWVMDPAVGWTTSPSIGLLINPDKGWSPDPGKPGYNINWWDAGAINLSNGTSTLSWDYQTKTNGGMNGVDSTQFKFILKVVQWGYLAPTAFYLDKVKLSGDGYVETTPEPATMALLGLGSLALLRRKR